MASTMYDHNEIFRTYLEKTNEKRLFAERFAEEFLSAGKTARLLDIGCHDGSLTLQYLKAIQPKLPSLVEVTCVDPSAEAVRQFEKREKPRGINFHFFVGTCEEFLEQASSPFDWIVASHSLYWSPVLSDVIETFLNLSGHLAVVLRESIGIFQLQSRFRGLVGNEKERFYTAIDIENSLKKLGAHFKSETARSHVAIPSFHSREFADLVSFFLQSTPEMFSPSSLREVYDYLQPFGERFPHHVRFFWVTGNSEKFSQCK